MSALGEKVGEGADTSRKAPAEGGEAWGRRSVLWERRRPSVADRGIGQRKKELETLMFVHHVPVETGSRGPAI